MEVRHLIHSAYRQAQEVLIDYKPKLVQVAEYLIEHEAISGDALVGLFNDDLPGHGTGTRGADAGAAIALRAPGAAGESGRPAAEPGPVVRQHERQRPYGGRLITNTTFSEVVAGAGLVPAPYSLLTCSLSESKGRLR